MLLLRLQTPKSRYMLDTSVIAEIIPLVHYTAVPNSPEFITGVINFRGRPVPVVDLGQLIDKMPCRQRVNTRIILVKIASAEKKQVFLGIIAESISRTLHLNRAPEQSSEMLVHELLDPDKSDQQQFVQLLDLEKVLGPERITRLVDYC